MGLTADARLRGTEVTLAAAGRSGGVTTAMTYEVRVGTSICDNALRTSSSPITTARLETKGITRRQMFAGRCVNTIVLTRPKRRATRTATKKDAAVRRLVQKKMVDATDTGR